MSPITHSKKVLLAPSAFFSFIDRNHPKHSTSRAYFRYFANEGYRLFTTANTVTITYNQLQKHMSYSIAKTFLRTIYLGDVDIIYPDEAMTKSALRLIFSNTGGAIGFEQALINAVADRLQIPLIVSFEYSTNYFGVSAFTLPY
jgi:predicted nucleic acid-binding protein